MFRMVLNAAKFSYAYRQKVSFVILNQKLGVAQPPLLHAAFSHLVYGIRNVECLGNHNVISYIIVYLSFYQKPLLCTMLNLCKNFFN